MIAMALACRPKILIADEPTTALDVTIQAQIINLLMRLQDERKLTYLMISHDLAMVRHISDRIAVMYLGKIVEVAETEDLYENPLHPYTKALLSAIPDPEPDSGWLLKRVPLTEEITGSGEMRGGCAFANRCPFVTEECLENTPELRAVRDEHFTACVHVKT